MAGLFSEHRALTFAAAAAPVPAGQANTAPVRPCVGRWPFAPVLAPGQTLRSATMSRTRGNEMSLKIAQPFMAGFTFRKRPKSRPRTAESFANTGLSFVPAGTWLVGLDADPAINGWAIFRG